MRKSVTKNLVVRTVLCLVVVLGAATVFAASRLQSFYGHPTLRPMPEPIPTSYFGMTLHSFAATPWPSIPFASLRAWDTGVVWADIHEAPNSYRWANLDLLIALAQKRGVELVYTFGRTPRWASANPDAKTPYGPGQCAPPANIQYWDEFVRAIVNHANGKIKFWEIWNEPQNPEFYCGDVDTMVEMQRRAYGIIKAADPNSMILTPSPVSVQGPPWMSRFLARGGGKYADIMAFHGYLAPGAHAESIISTITEFKAVFAKHGQGQKPIWDTEAGWGENPWLPDPDLQAAFLAKFYLLHWSAGVGRFYWYGYDNHAWGTLWNAKSGLQKAGTAYREVHQWLQGATMMEPCILDRAVWACNLIRENGYRAKVIWTSAKAAEVSSMPVSEEYRQYRDLDGNSKKIANGSVPISYKPILVETATVF
jgi:polysaccharide biosynthesis protein PslG